MAFLRIHSSLIVLSVVAILCVFHPSGAAVCQAQTSPLIPFSVFGSRGSAPGDAEKGGWGGGVRIGMDWGVFAAELGYTRNFAEFSSGASTAQAERLSLRGSAGPESLLLPRTSLSLEPYVGLEVGYTSYLRLLPNAPEGLNTGVVLGTNLHASHLSGLFAFVELQGCFSSACPRTAVSLGATVLLRRYSPPSPPGTSVPPDSAPLTR
jgi:hypothetical protein